MLFKKGSNDNLTPVKRKNIKLEKSLQSLTEKNLEAIFGLEFISTEFQVDNLRIDTLAFDNETQSFVIIEYKRNRSFSVVDQGFAYLSQMLNKKAEFILEYNEKREQNLKRNDIDWSQSRIIFIAGSFTTHQQKAINFQDLPIELWEVEEYKNSLIKYEQLKTPGATASIKDLGTSQTISRISQEVKKYTIEDHFHEGWDNSRELFEEIRERILSLDDQIEENPVKHYIGYKIAGSVLTAIRIQKSKLIVDLNRVQPKDLEDPEKEVYYQKNSMKYYNKHMSQFNIKKSEDIDYAIFLIKQLHKKFADEF
ncbi:MAG: DUF5655 domain-containing protein [Patescibacteria group bacterium]|jgi:predicted transport protein